MNKSRPKDQARYREKLAKEGRIQFNRIVSKAEAKALQSLLDEMRKPQNN